jgi:hypothetical protein
MDVVVTPSAALISKRFDEFEIGDVVLVENNQAAGIKVGPDRIKFVLTISGNPVEGSGVASFVSPAKKYLVPRAVELRITR